MQCGRRLMVNLMNNLTNLQSQQQLSESKSLLTKSVERLTSGKRVNQAKDNPADAASHGVLSRG
ncbi:flagellin N-terminal helical domain-containing protein [Piscirickettsia salmonis]|nr:hypothetical protein [Piscirickettsia salmonis]ALY02646.1 hypothetical protein AWE47_07105 [Piscirickettsia salmonis]APS83055.1 hypothetical protein AVM71_07350 [Piscirickettsia salmonis]